MKLNRNHAGWAVKLWVLASVFVLPFLSTVEVVAWLALGAVFGAVWKVLPEGPETTVEPLPYADEYRDREVPRKPSPKGEGDS
ncbi:MAG TPA: hypothetical protein VEC19_13940 [Usitatibacter sp.]|nr:hypothetical protein [Usitatibacter sp.]